jgi:hypothetical protein
MDMGMGMSMGNKDILRQSALWDNMDKMLYNGVRNQDKPLVNL